MGDQNDRINSTRAGGDHVVSDGFCICHMLKIVSVLSRNLRPVIEIGINNI